MKSSLKRPQSSLNGTRKSRKSEFESTHTRKSKSRSKSARKNKKSKRRVSIAGSDDQDDYFDRLSKPIDHTETKKRILREEKEKIEMNLTRNS